MDSETVKEVREMDRDIDLGNPGSMTAKQARKLIRSSRKPIFGWVNLHADDGAYLQVMKCSVLASIYADSEAMYLVKEREDGIYIN